MADYFNYGMNEPAWKNYARKQRRTREGESVDANPFAVSFGRLPPRGVGVGADLETWYRRSRTGICRRLGKASRQSTRL